MSENTPSTAGMDPALDPPAVVTVGTERELLQAWLDYHRQTLRWKCSGLTPEQLCQASAGPSRMSLAGLMRHMTYVEVWWFGRVAVGDEAMLFGDPTLGAPAVEEWADSAGTINYEIVTRIGPRVARREVTR